MDEKFGMELSETFNKNKKFFWKEVKKEWREIGDMNVRVKEEDGVSENI